MLVDPFANFPESEWIEQFRVAFQEAGTPSEEQKRAAFQESFFESRLDSPYAEENLYRLLAACDFLRDNLSFFDSAKDTLVRGESQILIQAELIRALGVMFLSMPKTLMEDIEPKMILAIMRKK